MLVKGKEVRERPPLPYCLGIDPGASGGICLLSPSREIVHLVKMPEGELGIWVYLRHVVSDIEPYPIRACLELVGGYVGKGHARGSHMFVFGRNYGALALALCALDLYPFLNPAPQKWQAAVGVAPKGKDVEQAEHKRTLKARAEELYPDADGVTLHTCDALLLAHYAATT